MANAGDEILQGETIPGWYTADGLETYFSENRPGGYGGTDLYVQKRDSVDAGWGPPENLGPNVNTPNNDIWGPVSADGLTLYFSSFGRPDGYGRSDLYVTTRPTRSDPWGVATNLGPAVNSPSYDIQPILSPDGLLFFFVSGRPGGLGEGDLWMARRASLSDPWQQAVHLGATLNSPADDSSPYVSADGSTLYFQSARTGGYGGVDLWQAPIIPIVDFNGDDQVDGKDLLTMIVQLGGNDPLCDIGPYAWGDGKVDVEDLKVLAQYIGKEVVDGTLIAHWKLDETEGMAAHDSAGDKNGTVVGLAIWQPEGGKVGGALEFDGLNDFVLAGAPAGLSDGAFSVCAWVQGGAPGQAVLSAQGGAKWLYTNQIDGSLMTDLSEPGRVATPLFSDAVVTDGQWHRIALVWDGTDRILYVDGQEVARDAQPEPNVSAANLLIGCGGTMTAGSFWSGLIDDVRIYNRAVRP